MKLLLVLAFAVATCAAVSVLQKRSTEFLEAYKYLMESDGDIELSADTKDVEISPQNKILIWQLNRFLRKLQKKMPCGFPEYGIPPLAPVRLSDAELNLSEGLLTTNNDFDIPFAGFQNFKFSKFKAKALSYRIEFVFNFTEIEDSGLDNLGVLLKVEDEDSFAFSLKNLRLEGVIHYDTPILWGSNKIKSLKTTVSIEKCSSESGGILGNGKLNEALNNFIGNAIEAKVEEMTDEISDMIENAVVLLVNKQLKGIDSWDILEFILNDIDGEKEEDPIVVKCVPPPNPWA